MIPNKYPWEARFAKFWDEQAVYPKVCEVRLTRDQIKVFIRNEVRAAWEDGRSYWGGITEEALRNEIDKARAEEKNRILKILTSFPDSPVIQQVIELLNQK
jgi:hypothetical protein